MCEGEEQLCVRERNSCVRGGGTVVCVRKLLEGGWVWGVKERHNCV